MDAIMVRKQEDLNNNDGDFNPLLDSDEEENVSELALPVEDFALPTADEIKLPGLGSLKDRPSSDSLPAATSEIPDLIDDDAFAREFGLTDDEDEDDYGEDTSSDGYSEAWGDSDEELLEDEDDEDEDELGGFRIDEVLSAAIEADASDVDIIANDEVSFEVRGDMIRASEFGVVTPEITTRLQLAIISHVLEQDFVENLELDTAYVVKTGPHKGRRMRLSVGKSFGEIFMVMRVIADQIPTPDELGLPQVIKDWVNLPNGLVIFAGPTGSGKALHRDTLLPTPSGFKKVSEMDAGGYLIGRNGEPTKILAKFQPMVQEHFKVVFDDGASLKVCKDHLWETFDTEGGSTVQSTEAIYGQMEHGGSFWVPSVIASSFAPACPPRKFVSIVPVDDKPEDYFCFTVDAEDSIFLCTEKFIPTHNSTSFAAMLNEINLNQAKKIITIEKPIEYVYPFAKAVIVQREIGKDARTFSNALKSAMRQHPKIIMVGEVRDQEEVDEVLRAAETGHLALTTIHATSPPGVVNRIMSLYEGEDRLRILSSLKDNVRGIANQTLVKTVDGKGRFALQAVLNVTPEVSEMIGAGDVEGLQQYMRDNELTMEHQLAKAVKEGRCRLEDARGQAAFPVLFDELVNS